MPASQPNPFFSAISGGLNEWANAMDPESLAKGNLYKVNTTKAQHEADIAASRLAYRKRLAAMGLAPETEFSLGASELTNPTQNIDTIHRGTAGRIITNPNATPQELARASMLQGNSPNQTTFNMEKGILPAAETKVVEGANGDKFLMGPDGVPRLWDKKQNKPIIAERDATILNPVPLPDGTYQELQTVRAPEAAPSWSDLNKSVINADRQTLGNFQDVETYVQQRLGLIDQNGLAIGNSSPLNKFELERVVSRANDYRQAGYSTLASVNAAMADYDLTPANITTKEFGNTWWLTDSERDAAGVELPELPGDKFAASKTIRWDPTKQSLFESPSDKKRPVPLQSVAEIGGLGVNAAMGQVTNPIAAEPLPQDYASNPNNAGKYFYVENGGVVQFVKVVLTNEGIKLVRQGEKAGR